MLQHWSGTVIHHLCVFPSKQAYQRGFASAATLIALLILSVTLLAIASRSIEARRDMERAWQREQHYWLLHNIAIEYTAKIITGELNTPSETQTEIEQNQFRIRIHDPAPRIDLLRADNRVFFLALREEPTDIARLLQRMRRFPQRRNVQLGSTFSQRLSSAGFSSEQITCVLMKWRTIELRAPQKSPPEEDNTLPQTGSFFHIEVSPLSPDAPQWGYDLFFVVNRERASMVHYTDEFFYLPEVRNECDAPATR